MAKILIGNVKPRKGVDYMTPSDMEEMGNTFAKKEEVAESVNTLTTSLQATQEQVAGMNGKFAPAYSYGKDDLEAGTTQLETGKLHFVYEE